MVNAAVLLVTLVVLFPVLSYLPCVALSAVIMVIAIEHIDPWTLQLARRVASRWASRKSVLDLAVILLVAVLSVAVDIVLAVLLGVAMAALLFLVRMSRWVIRRTYRCSGVRSRKARPGAEMEALARSGSRILAMELQGALFFGSAEKLAGEIASQTARDTGYVILDLRRITEVDSTGSRILLEINAELATRGVRLLISAGQRSEPAGRQLPESGVFDAIGTEPEVRDLDRAIEWAEDHLLRTELGEAPAQAELALRETSLVAGFTAQEIAAVEKHVERVVYESGRVIFKEGRSGGELCIVAKGSAIGFL